MTMKRSIREEQLARAHKIHFEECLKELQLSTQEGVEEHSFRRSDDSQLPVCDLICKEIVIVEAHNSVSS